MLVRNNGDSLKKRYIYKFFTNLVTFVFSLVTTSLTTRALGPANYGAFGFLSAFFLQVVNFIEFGTTSCFYSKLSQRPNESELVRFYWGLSLLVGIGIIFFIQGTFFFGMEKILWPDQEVPFIWMAAILALLTWIVNQVIRSVIDAYGLTVHGEIAQMQQRAIATITLVLLFFLGWLNLTTFFLQQNLLLILVTIAWWSVLHRRGYQLFPSCRLSLTQVKQYLYEFYVYSAPLISMGFIILVTELADRWLLQIFAGSVEQGFFTLSSKIGAVCFMFTSAMTPLLFREFARASGENNIPEMRRIFQRYIPMLYAIAAFFAVFMAVQGNTISLIFGGSDYASAGLSVAIMAFYPIHQTYGQLSGSLFLARGETRLYRNISIGSSLIGLPLVYWFLAPSSAFGLELGAMGVAIKMVSLQFIAVNVQLWYNARLLQLSFLKFLWHQIYVILLLSSLALVISMFVSQILGSHLLRFFVAGCLYSLSCLVLAIAVPSTFSVTHADWKGVLSWFHQKVLLKLRA